MGLKQMLDVMDREELDYQMAYDLVEADEQQARRQGVPTPSQIRAGAPGIGRRDPDWFKKLAKAAGV
jgi:hypothetical protein